MGRISTRVNNQISLFGQIASSVENFYTTSGKTVTNYQVLVSAISAAQIKTQANLSVLQQNDTFNCGSVNPRGVITTFQGYVKVEVGELEF